MTQSLYANDQLDFIAKFKQVLKAIIFIIYEIDPFSPVQSQEKFLMAKVKISLHYMFTTIFKSCKGPFKSTHV